MITRKSVGAILFREKEGTKEYFLLRRKILDRYWGFAKGTPEKEETEIQTALRESKEESGLKKIQLIEGFREEVHYYFEEDNQEYDKLVVFFLAKVFDKGDGKVSHEHEELKWLEYEKALSQITYEKDKNLLRKAEETVSKIKKSHNP
jgi:bis(5'-nucleosidyl)-tetraphosphatase